MNIDDIRAEILEEANKESGGLHRSEAIFRTLTGIMLDAGFLTNPQWAPIRFKAGRTSCSVEGYDIDEEDQQLTVFAVVDSHSDIELDLPWEARTCGKKELEQVLRELMSAITAISGETKVDLDLSDPANDMVRSLRGEYKVGDGRVSCAILTTGRVTNVGASESAYAAVRTSIWDCDRLIRTRENGREQLVADFSKIDGIPCLLSESDFKAIAEGKAGVIISKVPGPFLAELYNEYRMRLLERNVRAFLQFTGKVNRGIRDTIHHEPENFLSFNNGISATASKVELQRAGDGYFRLVSASDFQIVNGGQTTASIARCARVEKIDVSEVNVAMKLTVVPESELEALVPRISRFANTQNRIQETDFYANSPWHVELEKHSRYVEADRDSGSEGRPIRWYYERVRGQYADELAKCNTPAQRIAFKARNPSRTKFTKTDLAKYLLGWEQEAHSVSLGAQKCFARLMNVLGAMSLANADSQRLPTEEDFRRICVLGLLHRKAESICNELEIVGYRAQLVAYSIMVLSTSTGKKLPWKKIWTSQNIPPEIEQALRIAVPGCDRAIRESAGARNVTEWCKKTECRTYVLGQKIELSHEPDATWDIFSIKDMARPKAEADLMKVFFRISADQWQAIANAVDRAGANAVWSGVARTMATRLIPAGRSPSEKQSKILKKALMRFGGIPAMQGTLTAEDRALLLKS